MAEDGPEEGRAALEAQLRAAEERAARASADVERARLELARAAPSLAPGGGPDFRPALRLLRPVMAVEAAGVIVLVALAWRDIVHEDVPPVALTLTLVLLGFFVWPGAILRELGRGARLGWHLLAPRALAAAAACLGLVGLAIDRAGHDLLPAAVLVAIAAVESVFVVAAVRAWPQRARTPAKAPRFDAQGRQVAGTKALRVASVMGVLGSVCLGIVGSRFDGPTPALGIGAVAFELAWGVLAPHLLAASLERSVAGAWPWLSLRAVGAVLLVLLMLLSSPYALLYALFSKDLLPLVIAGWPLVLGVEIAVLVALIRAGRAPR